MIFNEPESLSLIAFVVDLHTIEKLTYWLFIQLSKCSSRIETLLELV